MSCWRNCHAEFFPRPYPGEWLYSVLCRYHVHSGNPKYQTTVAELFDGKTQAAMAALYPNGSLRLLASQLPSKYLSVEQLAINNTLFPYFARFSSDLKKQEALERVRLGETVVVTSIRRFSDMASWRPRFCPVCIDADRQKYGEAYWHVVHQIPLMTVCPEHGCRLMTLPTVDVKHLKYAFFPLEGQPIGNGEVLSGIGAEWELSLAKILTEYQMLPLVVSPPPHNNLAMILSNKGYGIIQRGSPNVILDAKRLYRDLRDYFGIALIEQHFGDEKSVWQINRLCKWDMAMPERYALLQCLADVSSETMFGSIVIKDKYEIAIRLMAESTKFRSRAAVAEELGVTVSQLAILTKKYNIEPFWERDGEKMTESITAHFTSSEAERILRAVQCGEAPTMSEFVRRCVREYFEHRTKRGEH